MLARVARCTAGLRRLTAKRAVCQAQVAVFDDQRTPLGSTRRWFAKKAKKAPRPAKQTEEKTGPLVFKVNTLVDGTDPVELPDEEYPEWLWSIAKEKPSESELLEKGLKNLAHEEVGL